ncbi:protease pro-enzyme activation domain-containing protein [Granulicella sp. S156]|uniref:protease pro-enzyme activation domain-containing protein n=1 Tax=Granulicella sp. S156 TaxID=1747224 RepID=UPI00131BF311|nr:protease pro-enzyme activation domain-containing protein [Granulicella sp. S156]
MNRNALYRSLWTTATLAVCILWSAAARAQTSSAVRLITTSINDGDRVPLSNGIHSQLKRSQDLGSVSGSTPVRHMLLVLARSAAREQALTQYLSDVQNPASPSFHKWLTPAQYGSSFGAATDDIATLSSWLQSQEFTVEKVSSAANLIQFSGNVAQVQKAFNTEIHALSVNGERHMANTTSPEVPRAFASAVTGLVGLDDFHPRPTLQKGPSATFDPNTKTIRPDLTLFSSSGTPYLYINPADAATIYDVPNSLLNPNYSGTTYDGTGVTVGVVGDSNVDLTPVSLYREDFLGETSANVNLPTVIIDGADPGINGDEVETFLDLEVLGGIAPKAKINYYASDDSDLSSGLFDAIERAVDDNTVSVLSISFGECEAGLGSATNQFLAEKYQQAAAQGITITVSSGDSGAANCDADNSTTATQGLAVNGISSTPYNISVGGTDYDVLGTNFTGYVQDSLNGASYSGTAPYWRTALSYIPEQPWNDSTATNGALANNSPLTNGGATDIIGGGGGVSAVYSKPAFQTALTPADGMRDLPDVAFMAGNGLYGAVWLVCGSGSVYAGPDCQMTNGNFTSSTTFTGAGGTSAATPAFAGMLALVVQATGSRLGQANDVLYQLAASKYGAVFHDVTTGNNAVVCASGSPDCGSNGFTTGYDAGTGYDLASGLGSVDASAMLANWNSVATSGTSTSLKIGGSTSPVSVTHGTSLNFSVGVTPATATGSAALVTTQTAGAAQPTNNGQVVVPLSSGSGTLSYNGLPGGTYTVYARYSGDTADASSSSTPINVNIAAEASNTLLTVNAYGIAGGSAPLTNLTAIPYGSYIFSDASVYGTAEGYAASLGLATGSFNLVDNGATLGTAPINSGNFASYPSMAAGVYPFAVGTHKVIAKYPGDASYKANTSNEVDFSVIKGATTASVFPTSATLKSTASDVVQVDIGTTSLATAPTGTITLTANGVTLGSSSSLLTGSANDGSVVSYANFMVQGSQLLAGANTLSATYTGDSNYQGSSATGSVTVLQAGFTLKAGTIAITAGSGTGNTATLSATPTNGFSGVVNLSCAVTSTPSNATSPITCSVPSTINITGTGVATGTLTVNSTASTTGGSYTVTISGTDAATGKITASTTTQVTVTAATPRITLTNSGAISLQAGATSGNTATISVTPAGGYTGTVGLSCAVTSAPTAAVDPITCAVAPASVIITSTTAATSALTISSTTGTTAGSYTVTISGADAATGKITASTTTQVTVTAVTVASIALTNSGALNIQAGASSGNVVTINVTPAGGYTGTVGLSCAVTSAPASAVDPVTCAMTPSSVGITGTAAATSALTISSTARTTSSLDRSHDLLRGVSGTFLAFGVFLLVPTRRRRHLRLLAMLVVLGSLGSLIGCSGGNSGANGSGGSPPSSGTTAGTYVITVTSSATGVSAQTNTVNVTVN